MTSWRSLAVARMAALALPVFVVLAILPAAAESPQPEAGAGAQAANIPENYNCINCHRDLEDERLTPPVNDWMESVHREVGVRCADCHGGAPFNDDLVKDPSAGFIGKPATRDIPSLCAKCHADAVAMRAYNQRSDQFALYQGSVHGKALGRGDSAAPTCISCHGKHKILRVKDPNALVNRQNVPQTCGGCHADQKLLGRRRMPTNQLALYQQSWHYEKFKAGDLLVPTCVDCHSNHGVLRPSSGRVRTVCFNCHNAQAENYKSSAHWKAYKNQGEPVCLHCHGSHAITRPTLDKFTGQGDADCAACHAEDSRAYLVGKEIQTVMASTVGAVDAAGSALDDFRRNAHGGFEISALTERMQKTGERLKELNALTHRLDPAAVKKESEEMLKTAQAVSAEVDSMWAEIKTRQIGLAVAWVIFLGFGGALWMKAKALDRQRRD